MSTFTVTQQHLTLLRNAYVSWDDCEFGAPCIDPKRPYGGSDGVDDIAEILGERVQAPPEWNEATGDWVDNNQYDRLTRLHRETETALQIVLATGQFKAGTYRQAGGYQEWELVAEGGVVRDDLYVCPQCGPDPGGAEQHAFDFHRIEPHDADAITGDDFATFDAALRDVRRCGDPLCCYPPASGRVAPHDLAAELDRLRAERDTALADVERLRGEVFVLTNADDGRVVLLEAENARLAAELAAEREAVENAVSEAVLGTRQLANHTFAELRQQLLAALVLDDDGRTQLSEYITQLCGQRDQAQTELKRVRAELDRARPVVDTAIALVADWSAHRATHGGDLWAAVDIYTGVEPAMSANSNGTMTMSDNDPIGETEPTTRPLLPDSEGTYFAEDGSNVRTHLSAEVDAMYQIVNIFAGCGRDAWPRIARWVMSRYGTAAAWRDGRNEANG